MDCPTSLRGCSLLCRVLVVLAGTNVEVDFARADVLAATIDVRTVSSTGNCAADPYLSLYNDGSANRQQTWLYFDLSAYAGRTIGSDVTLTLVADAAYGGHLTGLALGTANSSWNFTGITWANQPGLTALSGVVCPNGDFTTGSSVTWIIPAAVVQGWVDNGYNGVGLTSGAGSTLHFKSSRGGAAPTLTFMAADLGAPTAIGTANPSTLSPGQSAFISVVATAGANPPITNAVLDASQLGLTSPIPLELAGGSTFTNTLTVGLGTVYGAQSLVATVADAAGLGAQASIPVFLPTPAPHKAAPSSLETWRSNRFGMFIHWGPVTLTGLEISWSRANSNPQCPNNGPTPVAVYDNLYKQFNPTNFNASNWVAIAKAAGMKYMVLTAKHCDGFLLWDSRASDYNMMQSPLHRDICRELADAAHAAGMGLGWYFSPMDWKDPRFRNSLNADFIRTMQAELRELLSNYGKIDVLWFDWDGGPNVYDVTNTYAMCRSLQPGIVIDNRLDQGSGGDSGSSNLGLWADYYTPEQYIGGFNNQVPWETCMTLGDQWAWKPGDNIKSLEQSLKILLLCAGGDGNLLYNLGPQPTGDFEQRYVEVVAGMGQWLQHNGESVYGTRGGPYRPGTDSSSTRRDNVIYLHLLPPRSRVSLAPLPANVLGATALTGGKVAFLQDSVSISLELDSDALSNAVATVKLVLDGSAMNIPVLPSAVLGASPTTNSWQIPHLITSSSDVNTSGILVMARQATTTALGGYGDQTVNGVLFRGADNTQNGVTFTIGGASGYHPTTFISTKTFTGADAGAYATMLAGAWYGGTAPITLGFGGLKPSHNYLVQLWVADFRAYPNVRSETAAAAAGADINMPTLHYLTGDGVNAGSGTGQYVIGTFTATGADAVLSLTGNESSQLNAFQLRDLTLPAIGCSLVGENLNLEWPPEFTGWTLQVQTNKLDSGVSTNPDAWMRLPATASSNRAVIPIPNSSFRGFYRLVYP